MLTLSAPLHKQRALQLNFHGQFRSPHGMQVLLRGSRIVLSDVEAVLESVPGVEQAVALVQDDPTGAQRLVAYVTPASADGAAVLASLRGKLPAHLMPASVTALPQVCSTLSASHNPETFMLPESRACS